MSVLIGNHSRAAHEPMEALRKERAQATLQGEALTEFLHGGRERVQVFVLAPSDTKL